MMLSYSWPVPQLIYPQRQTKTTPKPTRSSTFLKNPTTPKSTQPPPPLVFVPVALLLEAKLLAEGFALREALQNRGQVAGVPQIRQTSQEKLHNDRKAKAPSPQKSISAFLSCLLIMSVIYVPLTSFHRFPQFLDLNNWP